MAKNYCWHNQPHIQIKKFISCKKSRGNEKSIIASAGYTLKVVKSLINP
jgi:hypothetical protein